MAKYNTSMKKYVNLECYLFKLFLQLDHLYINHYFLFEDPSIQINFDKIPIIKVQEISYQKFRISIDYENFQSPIKEYFMKGADKKLNLFLYSLIINMSKISCFLYGGMIRRIFSNEPSSDNYDLDFCCGFDNIFDNLENYDVKAINFLLRHDINDRNSIIFELDSYSLHYMLVTKKFFTNRNIFLIVSILYKLIFNEQINNFYLEKCCISNKYYTLYFNDFKLDINFKVLNNCNYDFIENMLYLDKNITIQSAKQYNYKKVLLIRLVGLLLSSEKLRPFNNILNIIFEMIGTNYLCALESIYYIINKKLRLTHDNCFEYKKTINYYNPPPSKMSLVTKNLINQNQKLIFYRIPKFFDYFTIIYCTNCTKNNCICKFLKNMYLIYKNSKSKCCFYTYLLHNHFTEEKISFFAYIAHFAGHSMFQPYEDPKKLLLSVLNNEKNSEKKQFLEKENNQVSKKNYKSISGNLTKKKNNKQHTKNRNLDRSIKYST